MPYKGKSTTRSWASLPPDLIRLIVTYLILDVSATAYLPQSWSYRHRWLGRMAYNVIRDADVIEQVMMVTPSWQSAIEYHLFWQQAAAVIDPNDSLLPFARNQRSTPYKHFRVYLFQKSCIPCRVNQTATPLGLLGAKRQVLTHALGLIPCCKDHRKERFCGICLQDSTLEENAIAENEDTDVWPNTHATCRSCRAEKLWSTCANGERQPNSLLTKEAEAIGGRQFAAADWEARQAVDAFVEMGEGTIRDVILLCLEKRWLRLHTKISEMMSLAIATSRFQSRITAAADGAGIHGGGGYGAMAELYESEEESSEIDPEEEDDDPELMSMTEDAGGVRELAITDWARTRILEGHWYSPADQWQLLQNSNQPPPEPLCLTPSFSTHPFPYIPAEHPCPWNIPSEEVDVPHPPLATVRSSPPPSVNLCSTAYEAFKRQLRALLMPAMINIVRRLVMECAADGTDACVRAARMDVEGVARALRESGVWYNGMDWTNRRREEEEERRSRLDRRPEKADEDDSHSSSSSKSGSQATSPVLSTSTLQTTPSPPPVVDEKKSDDSDTSELLRPERTIPSHSRRPPLSPVMTLPIAIAPVLDSPTQIPSIPFIPKSMSKMPHFTIEAFKNIWRDACAPLFQCRCRICERAVMKANVEAGLIVPSQHYEQGGVQADQPYQFYEGAGEPIDVDNAGPTLTQLYIRPASEEEQMELEKRRKAASRKRSCEELSYDDEEIPSGEEEECTIVRAATPPKRARMSDSHTPDMGEAEYSPSSGKNAIRLEKRRSEELGDSEDQEIPDHLKRARTESKENKIPYTSASSALGSPGQARGNQLTGIAAHLANPWANLHLIYRDDPPELDSADMYMMMDDASSDV